MKTSEQRRSHWAGYVLGAATMFAVTIFAQSLLYPTPARAQVPDSGKQRYEMIEQLKTANKTLVEIRDLLRDMKKQDTKQDSKATKRQ